MVERRGVNQGKTEFVRQVLKQDPNANERVVNEAWLESGHQGTISRSSVGKMRAKLGLTDRSRSGRRSRPKADGQASRKSSSRQATAEPRSSGNGSIASKATRSAATASGATGRSRVFEELERDLDRVIFRVMSMEGLSEVEGLLRRSRRLLVLASEG